MPYEKLTTVEVERDGPVAWVFLNRPDKKNAMNPTLHREMCDVLDALEADTGVGCVVLAGRGGAFSAGQDLKEFFRDLSGDPIAQKQAQRAANEWRWHRLEVFDKPTIAMVEGVCIGGAFTQMIACDFAIAAEDATFCLSEINWGQIPGGLVTRVLTEALGYRDALDLCLTGRKFDGVEAARLRLVNEAVPLADLRNRTRALAELLMAKDPEAYRATKHALRYVRNIPVREAEDYLAAKIGELRMRAGTGAQDSAIRKFVDEKSYRPAEASYTSVEDTDTKEQDQTS
ncbi:p-hydroxycinnamoyl CoA hydratase/lyase [Pseudooceanicola aestuarii]|uniref:p-hydroxycinnamoyl CoA hydratase/lyase n=1 Tax=Pseudooceanicola aestuarii TaxID=2697319 RepID=UPI0013D0EA3F|nr:p-hydroxycinnamoyl CoA hydratase/lyase [Pseudooceanicola aestuarii]